MERVYQFVCLATKDGLKYFSSSKLKVPKLLQSDNTSPRPLMSEISFEEFGINKLMKHKAESNEGLNAMSGGVCLGYGSPRLLICFLILISLVSHVLFWLTKGLCLPPIYGASHDFAVRL